MHLETATNLTIDGAQAYHDGVTNLPTGPLNLVTCATGVRARVELNRAQITDSPRIAWYDPDAVAVSQLDGTFHRFEGSFVRPMKMIALANGGTYDQGQAKPRPNNAFVTITGGTPLSDPAGYRLGLATWFPDGTEMVVFNDAASTQNLYIRNAQTFAGFYSLAPGDGCTCYSDATNNRWIVVPTTFSTVA